MTLPGLFFEREIENLVRWNVIFRFLGFASPIPDATLRCLHKCEMSTRSNSGMVLNFTFNYGGRNDIVQAANASATAGTTELLEEAFSQYLLTSNIRDPDLVIRTSGEHRLSNFFLWQAAKSEFWFTDILWPDLDLTM